MKRNPTKPEYGSAITLSVLVVITFLSILMLTGCGSLKLSSRWLTNEIKIDGSIQDWKNGLVYIEKKKISFGLANDDQFLYMCLVSGDRSVQMQIILLGLNLWFDPQGGKNRVIGIKFPVGDRNVEMIPGKSNMKPDPDDFIDGFKDNLSEIEILDQDGSNGFRFSIEKLRGLDIELRLDQGLLIYEAKVPLQHRDDFSFAIGINELRPIGIGLETAPLKMPDTEGMRPGGKGGMRMGGQSSGRGGMPGEGRGMRPGGKMGMEKPKPIKIWAEVKLAREKNQ